jgi:hypothetical protein
MANGAHALRLVSEPPSAPSHAKSTAPQPPAAPAVTELELEIGALVAQATVQVCLAMEAYKQGRSTLEINGQGAELIAKLYELRQSAPDVDLVAAGKRALRIILAQNVPAAVLGQYNLDRELNELLSWPLGVLARVTASERARAN